MHRKVKLYIRYLKQNVSCNQTNNSFNKIEKLVLNLIIANIIRAYRL